MFCFNTHKESYNKCDGCRYIYINNLICFKKTALIYALKERREANKTVLGQSNIQKDWLFGLAPQESKANLKLT